MSSYFYVPTKNAIDCFESNGKKFSLSDEEFSKFLEIVCVFVDRTIAESVSAPITSPEVQEKRQAVCLKCPKYNKDNGSCNLCGCFIENKIKVPVEMCPARMWGMDLSVIKSFMNETVEFIDSFLKENPGTKSLEEYQLAFRFNESDETNE
jgi:hypothetical protein